MVFILTSKSDQNWGQNHFSKLMGKISINKENIEIYPIISINKSSKPYNCIIESNYDMSGFAREDKIKIRPLSSSKSTFEWALRQNTALSTSCSTASPIFVFSALEAEIFPFFALPPINNHFIWSYDFSTWSLSSSGSWHYACHFLWNHLQIIRIDMPIIVLFFDRNNHCFCQ